jgi:hypothetical protein
MKKPVFSLSLFNPVYIIFITVALSFSKVLTSRHILASLNLTSIITRSFLIAVSFYFAMLIFSVIFNKLPAKVKSEYFDFGLNGAKLFRFCMISGFFFAMLMGLFVIVTCEYILDAIPMTFLPVSIILLVTFLTGFSWALLCHFIYLKMLSKEKNIES